MVYWSIHLVKGHLVVYGRWYFCVIFTAVPVQHLCSASLCQSCKVSLAAGLAMQGEALSLEELLDQSLMLLNASTETTAFT